MRAASLAVAASDFSLDTFISARWYAQEAMPGPYQRGDRCISAQYERFEAPTDLRYTIRVNNYAEDAMGNGYGTWQLDNVCAIQDEVTQSQLNVTLCSVPMGEGKGDGGTKYYVLFHDEATGVALVKDAALERSSNVSMQPILPLPLAMLHNLSPSAVAAPAHTR